MKHFNKAVCIFFPCKILPQKASANHKLEVTACLEIADKMSELSCVCNLRHFQFCAFFPLLIFTIFFHNFNIFSPLFSLCLCLAYFTSEVHVLTVKSDHLCVQNQRE